MFYVAANEPNYWAYGNSDGSSRHTINKRGLWEENRRQRIHSGIKRR